MLPPERIDPAPVPVLPGSRLRVVSYNILADIYSSKQLYPYCPLWALKWAYRSRLVLEQLKARDPAPDIICLQEVQADHFESFLLPELQALGYDGLYKQKTRESMGMEGRVDGCALFYLRGRFNLLEKYVIEFNDAAMTLAKQGTLGSHGHNDPHESAADQRHRIQTAMKRLLKDNVAQIAVLETKEGHRFCVSNTHIFWDPEFADVKLWQTYTLVTELDRFTSSRGMPLILCGDFNSEPSSSVRLLTYNQPPLLLLLLVGGWRVGSHYFPPPRLSLLPPSSKPQTTAAPAPTHSSPPTLLRASTWRASTPPPPTLRSMLSSRARTIAYRPATPTWPSTNYACCLPRASSATRCRSRARTPWRATGRNPSTPTSPGITLESWITSCSARTAFRASPPSPWYPPRR